MELIKTHGNCAWVESYNIYRGDCGAPIPICVSLSADEFAHGSVDLIEDATECPCWKEREDGR